MPQQEPRPEPVWLIDDRLPKRNDLVRIESEDATIAGLWWVENTPKAGEYVDLVAPEPYSIHKASDPVGTMTVHRRIGVPPSMFRRITAPAPA